MSPAVVAGSAGAEVRRRRRWRQRGVDHRQLVGGAVLDGRHELVGQPAEGDDDQHREHRKHDRGQAQLDPTFLDQPCGRQG